MLRAKSALRYIPAITAISADLADLLEQHMDPRGTVPDVTALLYRWALESIGAIFLDARLGCLAPRLAGESRARGMIDCADVLLGQTMQELLFGVPLWKVYPTANYRKFNQASENLYRYLPTSFEQSCKVLLFVNESLEKLKGTVLNFMCGNFSQ